MESIRSILREGRKEDLKKKYSNKFDEETLDWILNISDLADFNHKYTDFVLKVSDPAIDLSDEWFELIIDKIKLFDKYQSQLEKKDINQYKSFLELENSLNSFEEKENEKELQSQIEKVYEDDTFLVVVPKTMEASCKYGSNTKWCTAAKTANRFSDYTKGYQGLFYIINKKKSTGSNYSKIAIHFSGYGTKTYYDSKDDVMNQREVAVFNYAFPEMMESIDEYYKNEDKSTEGFLKKAFSTNSWNSTSTIDNYLNSNRNLYVTVSGFNPIPDMPSHYYGDVNIELSSNEGKNSIDSYMALLMISYEGGSRYKATLDFEGKEDMILDLGLESEHFSDKYWILDDPESTSFSFKKKISVEILKKIKDNPDLIKYVVGDNPVWSPSNSYTFKNSDKGLIKKLVIWLNSGSEGTKLDFLKSIGRLEKRVNDGKIEFRKPGSNAWVSKSDMRGQFSTFFAAAKRAGILSYKKSGTRFLLTKGPNFDAFVQGRLKPI